MDKHELSKIDFEFIRMSAFGGKADNPDHCHTGAMRGAARPATTGKHGVCQGTR